MVPGRRDFYQKIWQTDVLHGVEAVASSYTKGTGQVSLFSFGCPEDDNIVSFMEVNTGQVKYFSNKKRETWFADPW